MAQQLFRFSLIKDIALMKYLNVLKVSFLLLFIVQVQVFTMILPSSKLQNPYIKVFDALTDAPLVGAKVRFVCLSDCEKITFKNVSTNKSGVAKNPFTGIVELQITFVGYITVKDTIVDNSTKFYYLQPTDIPLETVVTTGDLSTQSSQKSLFKVRILDRERIQNQQAQTVRDLLTKELNIRLNQDNLLGSSISLQGVSGQNVKILIDGVPVIGRTNGNIDVSQLLLNSVERVEIIEGPMSVLFGSDALGGVINIISKTKQQESIESSVTNFYESVGTYNTDARIGYSNDGLSASLSGGRYFFSGFNLGNETRFQQWKPKEQRFIDWQGQKKFASFVLRYDGKYFNELILNRGEPRAPFRENAFDDTYKTDRFTNSVFFSTSFTEHQFLNITSNVSYFKRTKNTYFKDLVTLQEQLTLSPSDQDTTTFLSYMSRGLYSNDDLFSMVKIQGGYDIVYETMNGVRTIGQQQSMADFAGFVNLSIIPIREIVLQPGIRYAYNSLYSAPIVPSITMKYDPTDEVTIRGSYANGFRAPSLRELFFYFVDFNHNIQGNPNLQAEQSDNFQLSSTITFKNISNVLKVEPTLFYNDIRNQITLAQQGPTLFSYINIGRFKSKGATVTTSYFRSNITASIAASYIGRYNEFFSENTRLPEFTYTPEFVSNVSYQEPTTEINTSLFYKFTGELPVITKSVAGDIQQGSIGSFHSLDLTFSRNFLSDLLSVSMGIRNIFDITNVAATGLQGTNPAAIHNTSTSALPFGWGRTITSTVRINL